MKILANIQWGVCAAALCACGGAWADMSTDQAVEALLGKDAASARNTWPLTEQGTGRVTPALPATRMVDDDRPSMVVPRGASLAALLAPVLRQIQRPKAEVFKAFVALNPHAFIGGNPNRLMAGATVHMFTAADVARLNGVAAPATPEARRGWVRFP